MNRRRFLSLIACVALAPKLVGLGQRVFVPLLHRSDFTVETKAVMNPDGTGCVFVNILDMKNQMRKGYRSEIFAQDHLSIVDRKKRRDAEKVHMEWIAEQAIAIRIESLS